MREGSKQVAEALYKLEPHTDHLALFTRPHGRCISKKRLSQPQSPCHHQCPPSPHSHPSLAFAFASVLCSIHSLVPFSLPLSLPSLLRVAFAFVALLTPSPRSRPALALNTHAHVGHPQRVAFTVPRVCVWGPLHSRSRSLVFVFMVLHVRVHGPSHLCSRSLMFAFVASCLWLRICVHICGLAFVFVFAIPCVRVCGLAFVFAASCSCSRLQSLTFAFVASCLCLHLCLQPRVRVRIRGPLCLCLCLQSLVFVFTFAVPRVCVRICCHRCLRDDNE
jgi:hypothetical protein